MKKINKTWLFLILTFVISYVLAGIFKLAGGTGSNRVAFMILGVVYMFVPTLCVLIVKKLIHKETIVSELMVSFKLNFWFVFAWLIMPVLTFATFGISLLFPGVVFSAGMEGMFERFGDIMTPEQIEQMKNSIQTMPVNPVWLTLAQGMIAGVTINAVAAFGEELGWRGFLLDEFKKMTFMKASLLIGAIWGIWHAPLILMGHNYPQHPVIGVFMMTVFCILLTPLFIYVTIRARSVIAAAVIHGTLNAVAGISIMMVSGGSDLTTGLTGLAGFIILVLFLAGLWIYDSFVTKQRIMTRRLSDTLQK